MTNPNQWAAHVLRTFGVLENLTGKDSGNARTRFFVSIPGIIGAVNCGADTELDANEGCFDRLAAYAERRLALKLPLPTDDQIRQQAKELPELSAEWDARLEKTNREKQKHYEPQKP